MPAACLSVADDDILFTEDEQVGIRDCLCLGMDDVHHVETADLEAERVHWHRFARLELLANIRAISTDLMHRHAAVNHELLHHNCE